MTMELGASIRRMAPRGSGKSFTDEQNARMREAAKKLLERYDSITALAAELDISQPALSNFLNSNSGVGPQVADKIARMSGTTLLAYLDPALAALAGESHARPVFRNLPGWIEALIEVIRDKPWFPRPALEAVAETNMLFAVEKVTKEMIINQANAWISNAPAALLEQLDAARIDAEIEEAEERYDRALALQKEMTERGEKPPHVSELMRQLEKKDHRAKRSALSAAVTLPKKARGAKAANEPRAAVPKKPRTPKT